MIERYEIRPDNKAGLTYDIVEKLNGILICACISDKEDAEIMCVAMNRSDSPKVIDAEKLAEKFWGWIDDEGGSAEFYRICTLDSLEIQEHKRLKAKFIPAIARLISDSIDLRLDWKDGKSRWGVFKMDAIKELVRPDKYPFRLWIATPERDYNLLSCGIRGTQDLAIKACEKALRGIITGVKDVG